MVGKGEMGRVQHARWALGCRGLEGVGGTGTVGCCTGTLHVGTLHAARSMTMSRSSWDIMGTPRVASYC